MNNPKQLNYTQQLEHRLAMVQEDIKILINFIDENRLMEAMNKSTRYSHSALSHMDNIEIACDLTSDESLSWGMFL